MRTKFIFVLSVIVLFLAVSVRAMADQRDDMIGKELDCVQGNLQINQELGWVDVCYASDKDTAAYDFDEEDISSYENDSISQSEPVYVFGKKESFNFDEKYSRENMPGSRNKKHELNAYTEFSLFEYDEPSVMKDTGMLQGVEATYTYRPEPGEFLYSKYVNAFRMDAIWLWGQVDYNAHAGYSMEDLDYFTNEYRGLFGKEYVYNQDDIFIYGGFGYRYLKDDSGGKTTTYNSVTYYAYDRESNYYYVPMGVEYGKNLQKDVDVTFIGEYDWFLWGVQRSFLSDGNPANDDISNKQNNGFGLRAAVRLSKKTDVVNFLIEPFWRFWSISQSETQSGWVDGSYSDMVEPKNHTIDYGIKLGLQF